MSKNTYTKEEVHGAIGIIVFCILILAFIWNEWYQNATIKIHTRSVALLIEDKKSLQERIEKIEERLDFKVVTKSDLKAYEDETKNRLDIHYDSISSLRADLFDLNEKLGDRIPNWNKR